jgi:hypothetical protein
VTVRYGATCWVSRFDGTCEVSERRGTARGDICDPSARAHASSPAAASRGSTSRAAIAAGMRRAGFDRRGRFIGRQCAAGIRVARRCPTDAAAAPRRTGLLARLFGRRPTPSAQAATPEVAASVDPARAQSALTAVLDEIGTASHRPFSREPGATPQITYRT